jgi:hypothetical protein
MSNTLPSVAIDEIEANKCYILQHTGEFLGSAEHYDEDDRIVFKSRSGLKHVGKTSTLESGETITNHFVPVNPCLKPVSMRIRRTAGRRGQKQKQKTRRRVNKV